MSEKSAPLKPALWNLEPLLYVKKIVAVASGKGGVGKSTTTVNLARALNALGFRVGILDADIYGPSLPLMMGLDDISPPVIENNQWLPIMADGIACMSIAFIAGDKAAMWRGPMVSKVLNQMLRQVVWARQDAPLDVLLVDMPPGTGDIHISMVQQVPFDGAVVVTTPQEAAVRDADKCIQMFERVKVPLLGVLENMSCYIDASGARIAMFGEGGARALCSKYHIAQLGEIPLDPAIGRAADQGIQADVNYYQEIAQRLSTALC